MLNGKFRIPSVLDMIETSSYQVKPFDVAAELRSDEFKRGADALAKLTPDQVNALVVVAVIRAHRELWRILSAGDVPPLR